MKALDALNPVFDHRVRLAIATLLARYDEINFARFKQELGLTDGNLGAQLRKLEDAGYIALRREFEQRRPVTWYSLTELGQMALKSHLEALRKLITPALAATR